MLPLIITAVVLTLIPGVPQLSVAVAVPNAALISVEDGLHPNVNVVPVAVTTGFILSTTVTVATQVVMLLFTSVTVTVTEFAPLLEQLNVVFERAMLVILQLPTALLLTIAGVMLAFPFASNGTVVFLQEAV